MYSKKRTNKQTNIKKIVLIIFSFQNTEKISKEKLQVKTYLHQQTIPISSYTSHQKLLIHKTVTKQLKFIYLTTIYKKYCNSKKCFVMIIKNFLYTFKEVNVCLVLLASCKRKSSPIKSRQLSVMAPV